MTDACLTYAYATFCIWLLSCSTAMDSSFVVLLKPTSTSNTSNATGHAYVVWVLHADTDPPVPVVFAAHGCFVETTTKLPSTTQILCSVNGTIHVNASGHPSSLVPLRKAMPCLESPCLEYKHS
jgi:hypothetical protein